jgi:hypothetical protein
MRWLLLFIACNSQPLDLPGDRVWLPANAVVGCNGGQCDEGKACCTQSFGVRGSCVAPTDTDCNTILACDGPSDCLGGVCCFSSGRFNGSRCTLPEACDDVYSWVMCERDADCPPDGSLCCPADGIYRRCMNGCF